MDFRKTAQILREKNCLNNGRNFIYGYNRAKIHSPSETPAHFISKSALIYMIFKKGINTVSEAEMSNGRAIDVLQVCKNGDLVGYELESNGHDTKIGVNGVDIVDIDLRKMPQKAQEGIKELLKWLDQFIIG
jgi:hypothetical protein